MPRKGKNYKRTQKAVQVRILNESKDSHKLQYRIQKISEAKERNKTNRTPDARLNVPKKPSSQVQKSKKVTELPWKAIQCHSNDLVAQTLKSDDRRQLEKHGGVFQSGSDR